MVKYNKVRTRRIGVMHYRAFICNTGTLLLARHVDCQSKVKKGTALPILEDDIYDCHPRDNHYQNHPLVNKGIGYWINKKIICTGYNIGKVYRPIFNHKRETLFLAVRKDIVRYAKILVSQSRDHLYKKELLSLHNRRIPEEIVEHIANYAWDIMLLLYP